jgi:protein tyrosine/serine phosphatase
MTNAPTNPRQPPPIRGTYWLVDGQLLTGSYPGSFKPELTRRSLESILEAGIRTFIDLTCKGEGLIPYEGVLKQLAEEKQIDVAYHRFSIKDRGLPATTLMQDVLRTIREEIAAGRMVYVHCWGGIGRTGTVAGCWLMEEGYSCDAALGRIQELRQKTPDHYTRSPETDEQVAFVRNWQPGR